MRKKQKSWIQQLSESYIRQNLQEAQQPPPMFPPGGNPNPQPLPEPSRPIDIPPMQPTPRPPSSAAMRSAQTSKPPQIPEPSSPYNTQNLFWNGQNWIVQEFDQDGNLIYNYAWNGNGWLPLAVPGVEIYRRRKNNK